MTEERLEPAGSNGIVTFVIRFRMEGAGVGGHERGWVAHVTNVLEQSERYVRDLKSLTGFIEEYLTRMGIGTEGKETMSAPSEPDTPPKE